MALSLEWTDEARADVRALDRTAAMHIFDGLYRYAVTGVGDVKTLQGKHAGKLRLRLGGYRIFFTYAGRPFVSWPSRIAVKLIAEEFRAYRWRPPARLAAKKKSPRSGRPRIRGGG